MAIEEQPQEITAEELGSLYFRQSQNGRDYPLLSGEAFTDDRKTIRLTPKEHVECLEQFAISINKLPAVQTVLRELINKNGVVKETAGSFGYKAIGAVEGFIRGVRISWVEHMKYFKREDIDELRNESIAKRGLLALDIMDNRANNIIHRKDRSDTKEEVEVMNASNDLIGPEGFSLAEAAKSPERWGGFSLSQMIDTIPTLSNDNLESLVNSLTRYIKTVHSTTKFQDAMLHPNSGLSIATTIRTLANMEIEFRQTKEG